MRVKAYPGDLLLWDGTGWTNYMTKGKIYVAEKTDNCYGGDPNFTAIWARMDNGDLNGWRDDAFINVTQLLKEE